MHHAEFEDARIVEVYNHETPWSREDEFFTSIVDDFAPPSMDGPQHVLDLGCGTGRLAVGMADRGYHVTGVDPARASLEIARDRAGGDGVTWVEGTSSVLRPDATFVAAVMTSHVSQFFLTDADWSETLHNLHRALMPGGIITFDMRDARAREWDTWTEPESRHEVTMPDGRVVVEWTEVTDETADTVSFRTHYVFPDGQDLISTATLRFRDENQLRTSLSTAGFLVEAIFGGWGREPIGHPDGELLVVARKR